MTNWNSVLSGLNSEVLKHSPYGDMPDCYLHEPGRADDFELRLHFPETADVTETCNGLIEGDYLRTCLIGSNSGAYARNNFKAFDKILIEKCVMGKYSYDMLERSAERFVSSAWAIISNWWKI